MAKTFDENIQQKFYELQTLMIKKQRDYGSKNILNTPVDPSMAVLVRLGDKLARAANLLEKGKTPENESLIDTAMDIANYGVILWCVLEGSFDLPLAEDANAIEV